MSTGFFVHFWRIRLGAYWSGDMLLICFFLTLASCFVFLNCSVSLIVFVRSVYWLVPRPFSRLSVRVATSFPGFSSAWPCGAQQGREDPANEVVVVAAQVLREGSREWLQNANGHGKVHLEKSISKLLSVLSSHTTPYTTSYRTYYMSCEKIRQTEG